MQTVNTQLRWPVALRDQITAAAAANRRSMNSEILARLEATLADGGAQAAAQVEGGSGMSVQPNLTYMQTAPFEVWSQHIRLVMDQDGLTPEAASFRAECEGPEGFIRRKETQMRGGVAA